MNPGSDTTPPQVTILEPAAAAQVASSFTLKSTVTDNVGVTKVEVMVDGTLFTSRNAAPFDFPLVLTAGAHQLQVIGYDAAGNKGDASIALTVTGGSSQPPGGNPDPPGTTPGSFGATCTVPTDCQSTLCAKDEDSGKSFCTQTCTPGPSACPNSAECSASQGGVYVCAPTLAGQDPGTNPRVSDGGLAGMTCAMTASPAVDLSLILMLSLAVGLRIRRRR